MGSQKTQWICVEKIQNFLESLWEWDPLAYFSIYPTINQLQTPRVLECACIETQIVNLLGGLILYIISLHPTVRKCSFFFLV